MLWKQPKTLVVWKMRRQLIHEKQTDGRKNFAWVLRTMTIRQGLVGLKTSNSWRQIKQIGIREYQVSWAFHNLLYFVTFMISAKHLELTNCAKYSPAKCHGNNKKDVSFIVCFCVGKYSFHLNTTWNTPWLYIYIYIERERERHTHTWLIDFNSISTCIGFCQWSERIGFNPRLSHTKDSKNGTWCHLA